MPIRVNGEDRWEPIPERDITPYIKFDFELLTNKIIDLLILHINNHECQKIVRDFIQDYIYEYVHGQDFIELYNTILDAIKKEVDLVAQKDIL